MKVGGGSTSRWISLAGVACLASVLAAPTPNARAECPAIGGPLHTSGDQILDENDCPFRIAGVTWFGFETRQTVVHGLDRRNFKQMLQDIKAAGFNTVRLPYATELFEQGPQPDQCVRPYDHLLDGGDTVTRRAKFCELHSNLCDASKNPVCSLSVLDRIIKYAGKIHLRVVLVHQRSTFGDGPNENGLWIAGFGNQPFNEQRWIDDWKGLAARYRDTAVIGADLHNAPGKEACWRSRLSDPGCPTETNWRRAAKTAGNAILEVAPDWLIFVEGVEFSEVTLDRDPYWPGGNLIAAKDFPVNLAVPGRLVYAVQDYSVDVQERCWLNGSTPCTEPTDDYPKNLSRDGGVWKKFWGYIHDGHLAPVYLAGFGTTLVDNDLARRKRKRKWLKELVAFLGAGSGGIGWTFFAWNADTGWPNLANTVGGILVDEGIAPDWNQVDQDLDGLLSSIKQPVP
jgi:aryl-phospho-beta-D-glucosidase BglC (GH1 family)